MTPDEARQEIGRELAAGESVLWHGVPRQGFQLRSSDLYLIPFSLLWGGFAFFWESSVLKTNAPGFFKLWGIPFVLMGAYLILGRFFVDAVQRGRTAYGLTSSRAIIVSGFWSRSVKSLPLKSMEDFTLSELADGSGTITLGPLPQRRGFPGNTGAWPGAVGAPAFEMIDDARNVYTKIRGAQAAA